MIDSKLDVVSAYDNRHTGHAQSDVVNDAGELALSVVKRGTLSDGDWSGFHRVIQCSPAWKFGPWKIWSEFVGSLCARSFPALCLFDGAGVAEGLVKAGMVAFVKRVTPTHWHGRVNEWIGELITAPLQSHKAKWEHQDRLTENAAPGTGVTEYESIHSRPDGAQVHLTNFWMDLTAQ